MNILIKQARVISENNELNNKVTDILVEGGLIVSIKKSITPKPLVKVIEAKGLCVSTGWLDMQAVSGDPGYEYKENIESLIKCAAAGGFTAVCVHNSNEPALHSKSQIEYLINKTRNKVVDVMPLGTITVNAGGAELAEMYDMKKSGAVAFSDYKHSISDAGTLMRAMQYADNIGSFIVTHCGDESIAGGWQMNEGETSVTLGLKGLPALAEEMMLQRNISILEYNGGKMHIPTITSKGSVELIKKAKAAGLNITCGVSAAHLYFDDSVLKDFDTNYKLNPPLRSKRDVQALRNGVENGIIDVIVSDHLPQDVESKELEFDMADFGMINLQTTFGCVLESLREKNIHAIVNALTVSPRKILGLEQLPIAEGVEANLTLFNMSEDTVLTERNNHSRANNSPFFNKTLKGGVVGVIRGSRSFFN